MSFSLDHTNRILYFFQNLLDSLFKNDTIEHFFGKKNISILEGAKKILTVERQRTSCRYRIWCARFQMFLLSENSSGAAFHTACFMNQITETVRPRLSERWKSEKAFACARRCDRRDLLRWERDVFYLLVYRAHGIGLCIESILFGLFVIVMMCDQVSAWMRLPYSHILNKVCGDQLFSATF